MAKRGKSRDTLVWTVVAGLVLVGVGLYLRDRGLLKLPEPKPVAPAERAKDLAKKYPDAEVFSGPETDKKKTVAERKPFEAPPPAPAGVRSEGGLPKPNPSTVPATPYGPPEPPVGKEVRRAEPIATDRPKDIVEMGGWQALLDRLNFSCGTIDGHFAKRSRRAVTQFQINRGLATTGELDIETRLNLGKPGDAYVDYTVTAEDLARLVPRPKGYLEMSKMAALDYHDPWEMLAEKSHSTPAFLRQLNPGVTNLVAGTRLTIPNLEGTRKLPPVGRIVIMISETTLLAFDTNNKVVACFPCSIAADKTKVPNQPLTVVNIAPNPNYTFDPKVLTLAAQQEGITNRLILPPGPNNPVGTAWIGLSLQGYGIHGTPEPEDISRTGSHGCFRLANWNATKLVNAVRPGIPVEVVP